MATLGEIIFWTMITLIVIFSALIILVLGVTLAGTPVEVESNDKLPIGNYGEDHLLSCFLPSQSGAQLSKVTVIWVKEGLTGVVYHYNDGAPALHDQNKVFKGRTQLFPNSVISGNGSLLLRNVRRTDSGIYTCTITSSIGRGTVKIHLRTAAYVAPQFTFRANTLTAEADRWFPKPNVTWQDLEGAELSGQTNVSTSGAIFAVVSSVTPAAIQQIFTCTIANDLVISVSTATIKASGVSVRTYVNFDAAPPLLASSPQLTFILCLLCITYSHLAA
ncbi:V-set domain-containing T-cell activation inhibitor 1 [Genypterus blacodes]|uniref:V-set domain-containing T-cell activation inhibitor 1 n=1 Tax=Genypterus blacodes TaxID=154954 RepID=UPI003F7593C8